ncbi:hypothetical protein EDD18DRAFT_1459922 [Armillaria luteobubalina]|uniref:Protein kinase domain-containing protein n=1 Tax=Armillaria luteobubalina TaxID=153913 RepID=A0AA39URR7_9AGAR|nr:hypothetical protein EDD18DRAFT_1459922 [Armillaria luteobubalina]
MPMLASLRSYHSTRYASSRSVRLFSLTMNGSPPVANSKHLSVDVKGNTAVDLKFIEEPLDLTQEQSYGYPGIVIGDLLGPNSRYEILRKLGWGLNSSVWLARDRSSTESKCVSIKALKGYATEVVNIGILRELKVLQLLGAYRMAFPMS